MHQVTFFTPGQLKPPGPPLASYRSPSPAGALAPYLDAYTRPGDLVIDLFCSRPTFVLEAVRAGRRALGLNVNRALLLAASLGLTAVERHAVEAAFTRLSEAPKGPRTLQAHLEAQYRTTCVACGASVMADAFVWEREAEAPVAKRYRCACNEGRPVEVPTDEADRAAAARFERRGLSYWLLLDRAAPRGSPHRERVASLLELYTPRNLSALADLLLKSDGLSLPSAVRQALDALLLDTFDQATSLRPPDAPMTRPRRLQRPTRYLEPNVWLVFEQALNVWREMPLTPIPLVSDPRTLATGGGETAAALAPLSSAQARRLLPDGCAALILVDPPRPDTVLWHLSALWCHWLWGEAGGGPLRPILSRRRLDRDWLWQGLQGALQTIAPLLHPEGRMVCLFTDDSPALLEAVMLAAAGAGYELVGWGACPPQARMVWGWRGKPPVEAVEVDALSRAVADRVAAASTQTVHRRGEPVAWPMLHAALYADLAQSGLLAHVSTSSQLPDPLAWLSQVVRAALNGAPLRQLTGQPARTAQLYWWLDETASPPAVSPLSDRVELAVAEILYDLLAVSAIELERRVCARFPGPQTPPPYLIRLCLFSYGDEYAPGHWRLRAEDDPGARAAEAEAVVSDLSTLGQRLGFHVVRASPGEGWTVRWLDEEGQVSYAFVVRTTAVLGDLLTRPSPRPDEARPGVPCLTLPGGRAVLVGYKLRHNPYLRQQVEQHGWQFLKFRHLRHLVREAASRALDRFAFRAALGLDPIVEQDEAQLPLW